jgi:hypothetical protein
MARQLKTNTEIDAFITRVIGEANHHGANVNSIIKPLSDEVRNRLNLGIDRVEVYERNGKLARTCWVTLEGKRHVFSYNYHTQKIELRSKTLQGAVLFEFDNNTTQADIVREVAKL